MMIRALPLLLISFPFAVSAAEIAMRPGLWEVTTTSHILNYASQITPEQQRQLKDLADQYGFEMPEIQDGAAKSLTCVTPEQAAQKILPSSFENQIGCSVSNIQHSGNQFSLDYTCDNPQMKGSGTAEGTLTTAESFVGKTNFKGLVEGLQVNEQADITGKWSRAICDTAKP